MSDMNISNRLIEKFLYKVDNLFHVPLTQIVDLVSFSKKLPDNATICAEFNDYEIVSMAAGYTNIEECS